MWKRVTLTRIWHQIYLGNKIIFQIYWRSQCIDKSRYRKSKRFCLQIKSSKVIEKWRSRWYQDHRRPRTKGSVRWCRLVTPRGPYLKRAPPRATITFTKSAMIRTLRRKPRKRRSARRLFMNLKKMVLRWNELESELKKILFYMWSIFH